MAKHDGKTRIPKRDRHQRMIVELRLDPALRISQLADRFGVSAETVRRDMNEMSEQGLVSRTYGGAIVLPMAHEPGVRERSAAWVRERRRIAEKAASLIDDGEVLMIDSGSTTQHFAHRLAAMDRSLTVITNSHDVAAALGVNAKIRVIMCPGDYILREGGVYGPEAIAFLRRFHANQAIIGAGGLTPGGITDADSAAVWIKRAMMDRSRRRILLLDRSKFKARRLEVVAPLDRLDDLITDAPPPDELNEALKRAGVRIHLAVE